VHIFPRVYYSRPSEVSKRSRHYVTLNSGTFGPTVVEKTVTGVQGLIYVFTIII